MSHSPGTQGLIFFIVYVVSVGALLGTLVIATRGLKPSAQDPKSARRFVPLLVAQILLVGLVLAFSSHGESKPSHQGSDNDLPVSDTELALLVERANHLEGLLAGSLMVFFIMGVGGFVAAVKARRSDSESWGFSTRQFFHGLMLAVAFVSGFYYFMLAQYYATVSTVLKIFASDSAYADLYKSLRIPTLGLPLGPATNVVMLLGAPLFPLAVATTLTLGMYFYLRRFKTGLGLNDLTRATALHVALCPLLTCHAFAAFLSVGPLAPKGTTPKNDQMEEQPYSYRPAGMPAVLACLEKEEAVRRENRASPPTR